MKHNIEVRHDHRIDVRGLLTSGPRALGNRAFGEIDIFAWVQSWEIDRSRSLSRTYRDPRFDILQECGLCQGEGRGDADGSASVGSVTGSGEAVDDGLLAGGGGGECGLCEGSGRIRRLKAGVRDEG